MRARENRPAPRAGEFVKEEMDHIREGKHGAANTKQAIAIGLSKARRAGVNLPPPGGGEDLGGDAREGTARCAQRSVIHKKENIRQTLASDQWGVEARRPFGGVARGIVEASQDLGPNRGSAARKASAKKAARTRAAEGRQSTGRKQPVRGAAKKRQRQAA